MSDVKSAPHITSTTLANGASVQINADHVYLAPEHLGEPYYVGRVMEFCNSFKRKGLQARIAWFNRPKDVINRKSADPCLLVATMHSDINPVSSIRGKCVVTHKYYIPKDQLEVYKKKQDHFYYNQLYDRYIQRVYDVVPSETVQNVPMDTLEALKQRYQFIVVEQGKSADLTVARRLCCVCQGWCSSTASVKCAACQKSYHMTCLNPPLPRKPTKGFAWQCAFCARQELIETSLPITSETSDRVSDKDDTKKRQTRTTRSQISKTQPQRQLPQPEPSNSQPSAIKLKIKHPRKTRNIDDRIYPRAKSRIGPKYQANVPDNDISKHLSLSPVSEPNSISSNKSKTKKIDKKGKSVQRPFIKKPGEPSLPYNQCAYGPQYEVAERSPLAPIRGGDDTVTCIYTPGVIDDEQVDNYMERVKDLENIHLSSHTSDLMDSAIYELHKSGYQPEIAYQKMSQLTTDDFEHIVDWSKREVDAFEQSIREHGHDLNYVKKNVGTKSMADIVRYFYQWKKTDRYEPVYSEWTKIFKPMKKFKSLAQKKKLYQDIKNDVESDEESDPTIIPKATYDESYQCMNCQTSDSAIWRRSPSDIDRKRKVFTEVLCDDCGIYWLKYAKTKPISELVKRENMTNTQQSSRASTVKPGIILKFQPTECKVCFDCNSEEKIFTCYDCGMSVHNDCYGIENVDKEGWICDPCSNKMNPVASYVYECILCGKSSKETQQPLKRTAGCRWAHVQCAAFIPEIKFTHPNTLSPIEYIGCVNSSRLDANCQLCENTEGACVACAECKKTVHVQCAIDHKFRLAFEVQTMPTFVGEKAKVPYVPAGLFHSSSPSGLMIPQLWCPVHNVSSRKLIDLSTRTLNTRESSVTVYAKSFKAVAKESTPATRRFRQAMYHPYLSDNFSQYYHHRIPKVPTAREAALDALTADEILSLNHHTTVLLPTNSSNHPKQKCASEGCPVKHTAFWWSVKANSKKKVCHSCHSVKT
ncbi:putative PHD type zinc finger protein with BAH domain-containing protein [Rhizopus stolonifer]|uniref:Putative PHD type zinc finger protein with BAH domain-containing protein n=1 Tax=Rhizopus stolonifer TaxID=4846 RepID=A0A367K0D2_RHIST|nr:putative PHD type zinc finger protein with BAH domain-containing protein [Rhizopus stolonifer]